MLNGCFSGNDPKELNVEQQDVVPCSIEELNVEQRNVETCNIEDLNVEQCDEDPFSIKDLNVEERDTNSVDANVDAGNVGVQCVEEGIVQMK